MSFDPALILRWAGIAIVLAGFFWYMKKKQGGFADGGTTKQLDAFAIDLTRLAKEGKIDPVVGREKEIKRVTQVITRRTKNNVILVGPPGVGKTAIVEGLALRIAAGDIPAVLQNKRVLSLQISELLAGTKYRGEFEQRIEHIVADIKQAHRTIILFIDEIHTVIQTRGAEGSINLSDMLKPALSFGDLQLIGATTKTEYEAYIKPEESWDRRFQPILIDEPTAEEAVAILQGVKKNYEEYHNVRFTDEAIRAAVQLSEEYIKGRQLPDKAIDLIDEAGAMLNVAAGEMAHEHATGLLHGAAKKAVSNSHKSESQRPVVDAKHIKDVVAEWVGMPVSEIH